MDVSQDTFISSTAWTERVGFSAALAVIKFHQNKKIFQHNKKIGIFLKREILKLSKKNNLKIKINELDTIIHFDFIHKKSDYIQTLFTELMLKENILANNLIYLSFSHKISIIKKYLLALDKTFKKISNSLKNNSNILKSRKRIYSYKRLSPKIK